MMTAQQLDDPRVNVRTYLATLWICHFILWIFGDMFALLQEQGEPVTDSALTYLAPTTAIALVLMIVFSLAGSPTRVRLANLVVAPLYLLLDIGFMLDATSGWEYYLGVFYMLLSVLIFWRAYAWPKSSAIGSDVAPSREREDFGARTERP